MLLPSANLYIYVVTSFSKDKRLAMFTLEIYTVRSLSRYLQYEVAILLSRSLIRNILTVFNSRQYQAVFCLEGNPFNKPCLSRRKETSKDFSLLTLYGSLSEISDCLLRTCPKLVSCDSTQ